MQHFSPFLAIAWAPNANAVADVGIVTTDIQWTGICEDCRLDPFGEQSQTPEFVPSPASAIITVDGTVDPETSSEFTDFSGNLEILGLSYVSELFVFTSTAIDDNSFLNLYGQVSTNGDSIISGVADFTLFNGELTEGTITAFFLLDTLDDGSWQLCVDEDFSCEDFEQVASDIGGSAIFGSVPEPSGLAIVGLGLLGLATIRLRRRTV